MSRTPTPYELLLARADRSQPFVTHYDVAGGRTELSVASTANGVAKAAGLLRDGVGLAPGGTVSIDLPPHWQLPVWVLGALSAGARCGRRVPGDVDVRLVGPEQLARIAAGEGPAGGGTAADEVLACSCDAFGMPVPGGVPAGVIDVGLEARGHPDVLSVDPDAAGTASLDVVGRGRSWSALLAEHQPGGPAPRLWVDESVPDQFLLAASVLPLLLGGSVVIAAGLGAEQASHVRELEGVTGDAADLLA